MTTDDLGALLIAERASVLTGRDDELVMILLDYFTGLRWAEIVGLEVQYARLGSVRVEWQLWEDDDGVLWKQPPKDDSYRTVDVPGWLSKLVSDHIARSAPKPCPCHGNRYVFRGLDSSSGRGGAVRLADVAKRAEVSIGTASNVLNHPARVAQRTRTRVEAVVEDLGFTHRGAGLSGHRTVGFRDVGVRSGRVGLVSEEGASARAACAAAGRAVPPAGRCGGVTPRAGRRWPGRRSRQG